MRQQLYRCCNRCHQFIFSYSTTWTCCCCCCCCWWRWWWWWWMWWWWRWLTLEAKFCSLPPAYVPAKALIFNRSASRTFISTLQKTWENIWCMRVLKYPVYEVFYSGTRRSSAPSILFYTAIWKLVNFCPQILTLTIHLTRKTDDFCRGTLVNT